jgi:hypothetical protein
MIFRLGTEVRNLMAQAYRDRIDEAGAGARIEFYSAPQPDNVSDSIQDQTYFGKITFPFPCASDPIDGVLSFTNLIQEDYAQATGDVSWARIVDAFGNAIADFDVSAPRQGGAMEINATRINEGGPIGCRIFTLVMPG